MKPEEIAQLLEQSWTELAIPLARYVMYRSVLRPLPKGYSPDDIVVMAAEKLISGERSWDSVQKPDLLIHLKGIIKSMLSDKGLYGRKKDLPLSNADDDCDVEALSPEPKDSISESDAEAAWKCLDTELGDNQQLQDIVTAIRLGAGTPKEISELSDIPREQVYKLTPKLFALARRAGEQFRESKSTEASA